MKNRVLIVLVRVSTLLGVSFLVACSGTTADPDTRPIRSRPSNAEHDRNIDALRPPKRSRPVIAVLADNAGTETTDFLIPYAVLSESNLADVVAVAPEPGTIQLMPALRVNPQETTASFDRRYPTGADYVIVPAMHHRDTPVILDWIRAQSATGATIVAICSGAMVLAETGLLENRAATTHWFDLDELEADIPTLTRVDDRRYVVDRGIVTTTGVTASVPVSLAIVESIGGRQAAAELARRLGAHDWSATHDSDLFRLDWQSAMVAAGNWLSFWRHERVGIPVEAGVDEISVAFVADAYSRTFRSEVFLIAPRPGPIRTKRGLDLVPDRLGQDAKMDHLAGSLLAAAPIHTLDRTLDEIECRYGKSVASFVALQLEYRKDHHGRLSDEADRKRSACAPAVGY